MAESFKEGDVVRLKSGGPEMTIQSFGDSLGKPLVWCLWFDRDGKRQEAAFPPATLETS